jgi:hypothetical protein
MLSIEEARLFYVFSFAFTEIPLRDTMPTNSRKQSLGLILSRDLKKLPHFPSVQYHESEEKEPPETRSVLYVPFSHLSISTRREIVDIQHLGEAAINCHMALFESGMGVIWLALLPTKAPSLETLCSVIRRGSFPTISSSSGELNAATTEVRSVYDIFLSEVNNLLAGIRVSLGKLPNEAKLALRENYPLGSSAGTTVVPNYFEVNWRDLDEEMVWHDRSGSWGKDIFQEPSIGLLLKVPQNERDSFDLGSPKRGAVENEVSAILHNISQAHLDNSHAYEHTTERLRNLHPDKRFRTFLHSNCLLVVHSEVGRPKYLEDFTSGLFRTYCAVRGCWYMYNMTNEELDLNIKRLLRQFQKDESTNQEKLKEIINTRRYFLSSLAVEDPFVRGIRLTDFGPLYDEASHFFRLDELRQQVEYKIEQLDKLYDMISVFHLRTKYSVSITDKDWPKLTWMIPFVLIGLVCIIALPKVPWIPVSVAWFLALTCLIPFAIIGSLWIIRKGRRA